MFRSPGRVGPNRSAHRFPHVPGRVVQPVPVGREGVDGRGTGRIRPRRCYAQGSGPGTRSSGVRRPGSARRPTGSGPPQVRRVRHTPIRPRRAVARRPTCSTRVRPATTRGRPDGPPGRRRPRCRHQADASRRPGPVATTARRRPPASGEVVGQETAEHERPARPLRGGEIAGSPDEGREVVVTDRVGGDPEGLDTDGPGRPFVVGRIALLA